MDNFAYRSIILAAAITAFANTFALPARAGTDRIHGWKISVLVEGAPLKGGANGLAFDEAHRLFVANVFGGTISIIDPETGELLDQLGAEQGVLAVDDLDFGPDGSLFWTDIAFGTVSLRSPGEDGLVSSADGTTTELAANVPAVNPITVTDGGRVFFAQCFSPETGVFEILDPDGATPSLRTVLNGISGCASNGMDHAGGMLLMPRWFEDRILRVDPDTGATMPQIVTDHVPTAVKVRNGHLYWVSQETGGVYRADLTATPPLPELFAQLKPGLDNLAFDSRGRLFVSSAQDGSVVEVLDDSSVRIVSAGGLVIPAGIAVLGHAVYTGDPLSVRGFARRSGELLSETISTFGVGPLGDVRGVFADGEHLILTSWFSGEVQIFDPATEEVIKAARFDGGPFGATRFLGDLVVAEGFAGRVTRASGADLQDREVIAEVPGAAGLAANGDDLYVTSQTAGELWRIVEDGQALAVPIVIATALQGPEGIVALGRHRLAVVEVATGSVKEVNLRTGRTRTIATDLGFVPSPPGLVAFWFNGIDRDRRGTLYVNGDAANVIYHIRRRR